MHLTRLMLNPARRNARRLLGNPHALHAAVMASFPPGVGAPTAQGRVLWRLDRRSHSISLYLVSPFEPDLTHVVEQAGWPSTESWVTRPYQPFLGQLGAGQTWQFRLTANPIRRVAMEKGQRSKAMAHVTAAQQESWLLERTDSNGFSIASTPEGPRDLIVRDRQTVTFPRAGSKVTLSLATFEGHLLVTDPDALRQAMTHGIGRAKGYGCGLLTLARSVSAHGNGTTDH